VARIGARGAAPMTREVAVGGRAARIRIDGSRVRYESENGEALETEFSLAPAGPGSFSVVLSGRSYRVTLGSRGEVLVNGRTLLIEVFDPRDLRPSAGTSKNHGRQEVAAPMPGKVVRVLVRTGDLVQEGQGLVVVEAMKMQNEMKSPKAGKVAELRATPDATVAAGEVLVVVE
jgi:biotin carboxyl carrier protein